jgi:hydrogenase maturation protease
MMGSSETGSRELVESSASAGIGSRSLAERLGGNGRLPSPAGGAPAVLVLGLGNDILCDDAVGLRVAAAAREQLAGQDGVTVLQSSEMGLALLDEMVGFDILMVVDAVQTGRAAPGCLREVAGGDLKLLAATSPHFLGLGEAIALGRELGLAVPKRVRIFAVEVEDALTVSTRMTPALEAALPGLVERVVAAARSGGAIAGFRRDLGAV